MTTPKLLVFDLDGTLIDSRIDLTNSVNATLAHFGKPTLAEPTVASYIGDGAAAGPPPKWSVEPWPTPTS